MGERRASGDNMITIEDLKKGIEYYREAVGQLPKAVYIHPTTLKALVPDHSPEKGVLYLCGVRVIANAEMVQNHYIMGDIIK